MRAIEDPTGPEPNLIAPGPLAPAARLPRAILDTLIYADLFDYPLTLAELARYLIGVPATPAEIAAVLATHPGVAPAVSRHGSYYCLRGREPVVAIRAARAGVSTALWPRARRYARLLRHFPFVRMIAVTGALAVDNVGANADIDLLVICTPGRVWICRRLLTLAVRAIRLRGDEICPNFILAADNLALAQQDLFTAHELAQMRPLAGYALYQTMLARNGWMRNFLPNAEPWPAPGADAPAPILLQRGAEALLRPRLFDGWEGWELARLRAKLDADPAGTGEVACTPQQCKGHTGHYRRQVLDRYAARRAAVRPAAGGDSAG